MKKILSTCLVALMTIGGALAQNPADSAKVYFRINHRQFDPTIGDNAATMNRFVKSVREANDSDDIYIIEVRSYASPDGQNSANERLTANRCAEIVKYVVSKTGINPDLIKSYPEGVAWDELRQIVASSNEVPMRDEVLDILDNTPLWIYDDNGNIVGGRKQQLMALGYGGPYRWMFDNIFPRLRNAVAASLYLKSDVKAAKDAAANAAQAAADAAQAAAKAARLAAVASKAAADAASGTAEAVRAAAQAAAEAAQAAEEAKVAADKASTAAAQAQAAADAAKVAVDVAGARAKATEAQAAQAAAEAAKAAAEASQSAAEAAYAAAEAIAAKVNAQNSTNSNSLSSNSRSGAVGTTGAIAADSKSGKKSKGKKGNDENGLNGLDNTGSSNSLSSTNSLNSSGNTNGSSSSNSLNGLGRSGSSNSLNGLGRSGSTNSLSSDNNKPEGDPLHRFALKTNLLYYAALMPNIELQWRMTDLWSLSLEGNVAWWSNDSKHKYYQIAMISPEVRRWLNPRAPWHGMYAGAFVGGGWYDLENGHKGYRGEGLMAGVSFGYMWPIRRNLSLEAGLGVGYLYARSKEYIPYDGHYLYQRKSAFNYFGPLKLKFAIAWRFCDINKKKGVNAL